MKLIAIPGSLRTASLNRRLLAVAVGMAKNAGAAVTELDLKEFPMPPYDGDIEDSEGLPENTKRLNEQIAACDGMLIACPEYNNSVAGTMKNVIDWVSRARPVPLRDKAALLMSASPGNVGGSRGLWALRVPLELLGTHVYPGMFSLPFADKAFNEEGNLVDEGQGKRLNGLVKSFIEHLERFGSGG